MRLLRIFTTFGKDLAGCMNQQNIRKCGWAEFPIPEKYEHLTNEELIGKESKVANDLLLNYVEGDLQIFMLSNSRTKVVQIVERPVDELYIVPSNLGGFINKE